MLLKESNTNVNQSESRTQAASSTQRAQITPICRAGSAVAHKQLLDEPDGNGKASPSKGRRRIDPIEEKFKSKSPFIGSVTHAEVQAQRKPIKAVISNSDFSMSAAVDSARPREIHSLPSFSVKHHTVTKDTRRLTKAEDFLYSKVCLWIYPTNAWQRIPLLQILFIVLLGTCASSLSFVIDLCINFLQELRTDCDRALLHQSDAWGGALVWWMRLFTWFSFMVGLSAAAIWVCKLIAPQAAGSGIPEMKSILAGSEEGNYLNLPTLIAKVVALILALGAGLPLGKDGPSVHIACSLVDRLMLLPVFSKIRDSMPIRRQLLAVACACGVSSIFGAPLGGPLFAIEVTSSYFLISLYWRCFLGSAFGAVIWQLLFTWWHDTESIGNMLHVEDFSSGVREFVACIVIGIVSGLCGAMFVKINHNWMTYRIAHGKWYIFRNRFAWSTIPIALFALISFPGTAVGQFMGKHQTQSIRELFNSTLTPEWEDESLGFAGLPPFVVSFIIFALTRFAFLIPGVNMPLPSGASAPCLAIGAAVGRLVGVALQSAFPDMTKMKPCGFAVLGSAAFVTGITRTISAAALVFEVTGADQHLLPLLLTSIVSYVVGQCYSVNIFDSMVNYKGLTTVPEFKDPKTWQKTAQEAMLVRARPSSEHELLQMFSMSDLHRALTIWKHRAQNHRKATALEKSRLPYRDAFRIKAGLTYGDIQNILKKSNAADRYFPYVDKHDLLLGVLHKQQLEMALARRQRMWKASQAACVSQKSAPARAYGALQDTLIVSTHSKPSSAVHSRQPSGSKPVMAPSAAPVVPPAAAPVHSHAATESGPSAEGTLAAATAPAAAAPGMVPTVGKGGNVVISAWHRKQATLKDKQTPFGRQVNVACEDINSIRFLANSSVEALDWAAPVNPDEAGVTDSPPPYADEVIDLKVWTKLGLDLAPFMVPAHAPMSLVHFYFAQLTLQCVFVVDKGKFIGLINKVDMAKL